MKQIETDVVVIGGGCAGTAAALTAVERGARVVLFEKTSDLAMGGNGMFAVETRHQRMRQMTFSRADAMKYFLEHTRYKVDARLVKAYVDKSAETIEWLERHGIRFIEPVAYYPGGYYTWHYKDPASGRITEVLLNRAKGLGATAFFETPVKQLIREKGHITGVIAEGKNGEIYRVKARAVIIGTGGFGENKDWVKKYTGHELGRDLFMMEREQPVLVGDGIRMAWEVGATDTEMHMDVYRGLPGKYGGPGGASPELGVFRQPNLMIDQNGERFVNEEVVFHGALAGNAVTIQKNRCAYMLFDEDTNKYYEEHDWDWILSQMPNTRSNNIAAIFQKAKEEGYPHLFMGNSIEEFCAWSGIEMGRLQRTLEEYNRFCETGRDEMFYKKAKYLKPVKRPPFYAGRFFLTGYGSLGGLRINARAEVMDNNLDPIPGLYAAGTDANTLCGDTYVFTTPGHTSGFAYNTGRIAGESAVRYIKGTAIT